MCPQIIDSSSVPNEVTEGYEMANVNGVTVIRGLPVTPIVKPDEPTPDDAPIDPNAENVNENDGAETDENAGQATPREVGADDAKAALLLNLDNGNDLKKVVEPKKIKQKKAD